VRAGALERGGACPRGRLALERGGPRPRERLASSKADLARGGIRRATLAGCGGHQGRDRVVRVFQVRGLLRVLRFCGF
jgi:hypothetical protein